METWKPIPSCPGYEASDLGRIRSLPRVVKRKGAKGQTCHGRIKTPVPVLRNGEVICVSIHVVVAGRKKNTSLGRLVLEAFVGPCPPGQECCHGPAGPEVNTLDNLRWDTRKANSDDRRKWGKPFRDLRGPNSPTAKLTFEEVQAIRREFAEGKDTARGLAARYGVSDVMVYKYVNGKSRVGL